MTSRLLDLTGRFEDLYGDGGCRFFRAPGRVNLIGEHTDYNDGFVLPMAIDRDIIAAARGRDDGQVRVHSVNLRDGTEFSLDAIREDESHAWVDYVRGVALFLRERFPGMNGMDAVFEGTVPVASGLSSSAAIEVAAALALLGVNGLSMERRDIALLCQRAENEFVGAKCGAMDQLASVFGEKGRAVFLDCRSLDLEPVSVPDEAVVVVCDTMKRREIGSSEYNRRVEECEGAVGILGKVLPGVTALRDVSCEAFEAHRDLLPPPLDRRAEHIVHENRRVEDTVAALKRGDLARVGTEMAGSHESLRTKYEVSCDELDVMVRVASEAPGCIGARMTGGGFGGCTVNLVERDLVGAFEAAVGRDYLAETGTAPEVYVTDPSQGAEEVASGGAPGE